MKDNPRLSLYCNWKVVEKDSNLSGLNPIESLAKYSSANRDASNGIVTAARTKMEMIVAHSSQWKEADVMKAREEEKEKKWQKTGRPASDSSCPWSSGS